MASSYGGLLLIALSSTLLLLQFSLITAPPPFSGYIYEICRGGNYTQGSPYEDNLIDLRSSLYSYITPEISKYYNASVGEIPNRVYWAFQCRGDVGSEDCKTCAVTAGREIMTRCPNKTEAVVFYDECWLHYANFFIALSSTLLLLQFPLITAQTYVYEFCLGGNYTQGSPYQDNLSSLLSSISNNITPENSKYYRESVGRNPDIVYGLFQCRGDLSSEDCSRCAGTAAQEITTRCPNKKEAVAFYDECWLHYANFSFVSTLQLEPTESLYNVNSVSDPNPFITAFSEVMERLVGLAVSATNLFAIGEGNLITSQKMYGLVQCTQDLSPSDCNRCLRKAVSEFPICCSGNQGGRVVKPSCIARYETYKFYQAGANTTTAGESRNSSKAVMIIVVPTVVVSTVFLSIVTIFFYLRRKNMNKSIEKVNEEEEIGSVESPQFNFRTIQEATNNFSDTNKLGIGGFGIVYKGVLSNGQEIAVKRLSRNSAQGVKEFKNEVMLVVKLQHRNLVKLLGFCLEGDEKLLIYEFAPNGSLDHCIFDFIKSTGLDWEKRYMIIGGIARGLLYLHVDSRLKIIHRDLKAGNILLDAQMEPKISDFGMARLFGVDQIEDSTGRIVGTYGYMAPEYAMHGQFSVKSDVFSFGVLILEIVSGKKNKCYFHSKHADDLLSYAWRHWEVGTTLELIQPSLKEHYSSSEVIRCIHIGLLCVQEDANLRPTMAAVVHMLNSESIALPLPSTPAFFVIRIENPNMKEHGYGNNETNQQDMLDQSLKHSINEVSMTNLEPR